MSDLMNIDYDLKPQPRERSCTWPMKNPVNFSKETPNDISSSNALRPALEEPCCTDELMNEGVSLFSSILEMQDDYEKPDGLLYQNFLSFSEVDNNANSETLNKNQVADYTSDSSGILTLQEKIARASDTLNNNFSTLETIPQETLLTTAFEYGSSSSKPTQSNAENNLEFINNLSTSPDKQTKMLPSASVSTTAEANTNNIVTASKPKSSSRKNAWGNLSYADLITQAIESSLEKRLTLAQIYDWMVKNIDYFKDKGDSNSSAGWKNSIRHNLSLHNKFKRVQNEGTGKSSWWIINYDAKPHKPNRKRATSLETNNSKMKNARARVLMKKSELLKKRGLKRNSNEGGLGDCDQQRSSSLFSDFRNRTHSDASSIGGRISPHKPHLLPDLETEGPQPLSPTRLSSSYTAPNAFSFIGRNGGFNMTDRSDTMSNSEKLLEQMENMEILPISPPLPGQASDSTSIYFNQTTSAQHRQQAKVTGSSSISADQSTTIANQANQGSAPNIRRLISKNPQPNTRFPNSDFSFTADCTQSNVYMPSQPQYKMADNNGSFKQNGEQVVQRTVLISNATDNQSSLMTSPQANLNQFQYGQPHQPRYQQRNQQQHHQPQQVYAQQQSNGGNLYTQVQRVASNNQQSLTMIPTDQQNFSGLPTDAYPGMPSQVQMMGNPPSHQQASGANMAPDCEYPTDLFNLDQSDIFNPGQVDLSGILQDMNRTDMNGMDFTSCFPQENNIDLFDMDNCADSGFPLTAFESGEFSTAQYPPNPPCIMSGSRSSSGEQAPPQLAPLNSTESRQTPVFTLLNGPLDDDFRGENIQGFSNHFAYSHPVKIEKLSQGVGAEFHMR